MIFLRLGNTAPQMTSVDMFRNSDFVSDPRTFPQKFRRRPPEISSATPKYFVGDPQKFRQKNRQRPQKKRRRPLRNFVGDHQEFRRRPPPNISSNISSRTPPEFRQQFRQDPSKCVVLTAHKLVNFVTDSPKYVFFMLSLTPRTISSTISSGPSQM